MCKKENPFAAIQESDDSWRHGGPSMREGKKKVEVEKLTCLKMGPVSLPLYEPELLLLGEEAP